MPGKIARALLEAYSRGEITRREIKDQTGQAFSFGALLMQLHGSICRCLASQAIRNRPACS